jgi:hypothetical protein
MIKKFETFNGKSIAVYHGYGGEPAPDRIKFLESVGFSKIHYPYIDFDEDGNEVTGSREEWTETVFTGSREVNKSLKNMSSLTGSIYDFVYTQLKGKYGEIFGSENIIDEI